MSNQCFWISILDWIRENDYRTEVGDIKINGSSETDIKKLKQIADNINVPDGESAEGWAKVNNDNTDIIIQEWEGGVDSLARIKAFAEVMNFNIILLGRDTDDYLKEIVIIPNDCVTDGLNKCNPAGRSFGNINSTNKILLVSYGGHYELINKVKQGNFFYSSNRKKLMEHQQKQLSPGSAPAPAPELFNDVLKRLITINAHGGKTSKTLTVPDWAYVMIPHHKGTSQSYTTPDASKEKLYEESLYENGHFNYSHGWKLYKPNDVINDIEFSVLSTECKTIHETHTLQKPLTTYCKKDQSFEKYCTLYCTKKSTTVDNKFELIKYNNKNKIKIKACGSYKLSDVFTTLIAKLQRLESDLKNDIEPNPDTISANNPILLIPFTCNHASGEMSDNIKFAEDCNASGEEVDNTPLHTYFMNLYYNKYNFNSSCKMPILGEIQYTPPVATKVAPVEPKVAPVEPKVAPKVAPVQPETTDTSETTDTPAQPVPGPVQVPVQPGPGPVQVPVPPKPVPPEPDQKQLIIKGFFLGNIKYYNVTKISDYANDPNDIFNNDLLIDINDDSNNIFNNHFNDESSNNNIYIKTKSDLSTILNKHKSSYETFKIINYYVTDNFITYNNISENETILGKSIEYINDNIVSHTFSIDRIISTDNYYYHMLNNYLILLNLINSDNKKLYLNKFYENIININNNIEIANKNNLIFLNLTTIFDIFKDIDGINEDELKKDSYNKLLELINSKKIEGKLHINFIDCVHLILKKTNTVIKTINIINEYIDNIKITHYKILPYKLQILLENKLGESFFKFLTLILSYFNILDEDHNLWYLLYVHNIIIIENEKNSNYLLLLNYIKYDYYKEIIKKFEEYNKTNNSKFKNCIETLGNHINNFKNDYKNNETLRKHEEIDTKNKKVIKEILIENLGLTINEKKFTLSRKISHDQRDISIILNYIFPNFTKGFDDSKNNKNIFKSNFKGDEHMIYDPYFYYKLFSNYNKDKKENNDITIINDNLTNIEKKFNKTTFDGLITEYASLYNTSVSLNVIQPITRIAIFLELFNINDYKNTNTSIIDSYDYIKNNIITYSKNRLSNINNIGNRVFNITNTIIKWRPIIKNIIDFFKLREENHKIITYFDLIEKIITNVVIRNKPQLKIGDADNNLKINYIIKDNNNNYILDLNDETTKNNSEIKYIPLDDLRLDPKYYKINEITSPLIDKKVRVILSHINIIDDKLSEKYNKIKFKIENVEITFLLVPFKFNIDLFKGLEYYLYINIENFNDDNMLILCYKDKNDSYLLKYNNNHLYFIFKKINDYYYHYDQEYNIKKEYYVNYADIIADEEELFMKNQIEKKIKYFKDLKNKIKDINENDKFDENISEYYVEKLKYNKDFIANINAYIYKEYKNALTPASNACDEIMQLSENYNNMLKTIYGNYSTLNNSYIENLKTNYNNYLIIINEVNLKLDLYQDYNDDYLEKTKKKFIDKLHRAVIYAENSNTDFHESNSFITSPSEQENFIKKFDEDDKKNEYKLELEKFLEYANQHEYYIIKIENLIKDINEYHKLSRDITKDITKTMEHKNIDKLDIHKNFKILLKENLFNYEKMIHNYKKFAGILNKNINKLQILIHNLNNNKIAIDNININNFTSTKTNYDNYYNLFTKYMIANDYIIDYYKKIKMFKNVYDFIIKSLTNNKFIIKFNKENYKIIFLLEKINNKIFEYNKKLDNSYSNELLGIAQPNKEDFDKYLEVVKNYLLNIQNIDNYHKSSYITDELQNIIKDTDDKYIQYNIIKETFKNKLKNRFKDKREEIENTFKLLNRTTNNIEQHNIKNIEKFISRLNTLSFDKRIKAIEKYVLKKSVTDKQYNYLVGILSKKNLTLDSLINYYNSNIY